MTDSGLYRMVTELQLFVSAGAYSMVLTGQQTELLTVPCPIADDGRTDHCHLPVKIRQCIQKADFTYKKRDENGRYTLYIVEDAKTKGTRTEKYKIKRKLFMEKFQMEISEV